MKPLGTVFDRSWRERCLVSVEKRGNPHVTRMIQSHYLRKWPGVVTLVLMLSENHTPVGTIVFALPPRETSKRYGGVTWELARLWCDDSMPTNTETWFISMAVKYVRAFRPDVEVLVSYADPSVGHSGTIYRAANWRSDGRTDQERKTPRFDYYVPALGRTFGRRKHVPEGAVWERKPRVSKPRFVMDLR